MALRVKNIAAGFYDASGWHPIRRSPDYDADRAGDDYGAAKDNTGLKYMVRTKKGKRVKGRPRGHTVSLGRTKAAMEKLAPRKRAKNPIPTKWVKANVKRVGNDIQVMLFPKGKVAKRRAAKRRTTRRRR